MGSRGLGASRAAVRAPPERSFASIPAAAAQAVLPRVQLPGPPCPPATELALGVLPGTLARDARAQPDPRVTLPRGASGTGGPEWGEGADGLRTGSAPPGGDGGRAPCDLPARGAPPSPQLLPPRAPPAAHVPPVPA